MNRDPNVTIKPVHTFLLGYCEVRFDKTEYDGLNIPDAMRFALHTSNVIQQYIEQCEERLTTLLAEPSFAHGFSHAQMKIGHDEVIYLVFIHFYDDTIASAFRLMFDGDHIFTNY